MIPTNRYLSLLFSFLAASAFAQFNATITVTDLSSGGPVQNANVQLNGNFQSTDALGQTVFTGLADGTYEYTVTIACYSSGLGPVTVAGADASSSLALEPTSTNNLFFYIGSPFALTGATVEITDGASFNYSFVTWDTWGGEMVENVPFGTYSYTISKPCYETVTGTVTVDCNNGDGIAVVAEPAEIVIDATVTLDGGVLTANASGMVYQWVDCDNGNAAIPGAIAQSFAPAQNGNYAVLVTSDDCWELSSCTEVTVTGIAGIEGRDAFVVYPDPFSEAFTVRIGAQTGTVRVQLFSNDGRVVHDETRTALEPFTVQTAHLPSANYLLRLTSDQASVARSVVLARQ